MRSACGGPGGLPIVGTTHYAYADYRWALPRISSVAIATQPVHRLQIHPMHDLQGHPLPVPKLHPGPCNSVGMRPRTDTLTDRHTDARDHNTFRVVYDSHEM